MIISSVYKKIFLLLITLVILSSIFLTVRYTFHHLKAYSQKLDLQKESAILEKEILTKSFSSVETILQTLTENKHIKGTLSDKIRYSDNANAIIESIKNISNGSIIYIMDTLGNVCLSTQFIKNNKTKTLLGKNYCFRPYFSQAMKGKQVVYPAVGVTTNTRGIYFSSPIYNSNHKVIGIAAIKMNTDIIQNIVNIYDEKILIITPEGIVFVSNEEQWLYGSINYTNQLSTEKLNATKQFNNSSIKELPFKIDAPEIVLNKINYILHRQTFNKQNWQILIMTAVDSSKPLNKDLKRVLWIGLILMLMMMLTIFLLLYSNRTRKITKQIIAQSREDLRITLNSIGDGVIATDEYGIVTRINPVACELLKTDDQSCIGKALNDIITLRKEKNRQLIKNHFEQVKSNAKEESTSKIRILVQKNGKDIPVSETASKIISINNSIKGYVFVYRNISKIYSLKQKLQENQFHLRKIIDNIPHAVSVVNEKGTLLLNNKAFEKLTGINSKLLSAKKNASLYNNSPYFKESEALNKTVIETGNDYANHENTFTDINKKNYTFHTVKLPFNYYKHRSVLTISTDITKRKHFQDQLQHAYQEIIKSNESLRLMNQKLEEQNNELIETKKEVESSNQFKTAFLQNISHEIRTPLNAIIGFIDLVLNEETKLLERKEHTKIIKHNSSKLLRIIEDILEISEIETGLVQLSKNTILLFEFINSIHTNYKTQYTERPISFITDFEHADKSFSLVSDQYILHKIIGSLLNNAFKYTCEGTITLGCNTTQNSTTFFIKDTGIGIALEEQSRIFDPFNQINDTTRLPTGIGLGLSISKRYAELINGKLWVESQEGKGSTFYLKIPLSFSFPEK